MKDNENKDNEKILAIILNRINGILKLRSTYLKNDYDIIESFVSPSIIRKDESLVISLSLDGQLNQILPFARKFNEDNSIFYTLNFKFLLYNIYL